MGLRIGPFGDLPAEAVINKFFLLKWRNRTQRRRLTRNARVRLRLERRAEPASILGLEDGKLKAALGIMKNKKMENKVVLVLQSSFFCVFEEEDEIPA